MEKNIIIEQLKEYNYKDGDEIQISLNEKNVDDFILSINDLENHNFDSFSKDLKLLVTHNNTTKSLVIKSCIITGKIPNNIIEITFECPILVSTLSINNLNYNGSFKFLYLFINNFTVSYSEINNIIINELYKFEDGFDFIFNISNSNIQNLSILKIGENDSKITYNFYITGNIINKIEIKNGNIECLQILDNYINELSLLNIKSFNSLISNKSFNKITFSLSVFTILEFYKSSGKELNFIKIKIREFYFNNNYIEDINLKEISGIEGEKSKIDINYNGEFIGYTKTNLVFYNPKLINSIKIHSSDENFNKENYLSILFKNCKFLEDGYYYLGGLRLNTLSFSDSTNLSKIFKLVNLKIDTFQIDDYDFGKTIFNNVSINYKLLIDSPIFKDVIFNNVSFTNISYKIGLLYPENTNYTKNDYKNLKDYYRQLKYVMDQNGNYTEGNHFFDKEMEAHGKSLNNYFDRFIYWIQKIISNFGNSWIKPLIGLLILGYLKTIIFDYKIYKYFDYINFNNIYFNIDDFYVILSDISKNINPLQNLNDGNITFGLLIYKIILGIFIYHLFMSLKRMTKR